MEKLNVGDRLQIQCYKHDGKIHRCWDEAVVLDVKKDYIVYCNIATPFIIEEDTIKYIDYDLDLRIFPNGSFKILDKQEYKYHKKKMNYSDDLDIVINKSLSELITDYQKHVSMFNNDINLEYGAFYKTLKEKNSN